MATILEESVQGSFPMQNTHQYITAGGEAADVTTKIIAECPGESNGMESFLGSFQTPRSWQHDSLIHLGLCISWAWLPVGLAHHTKRVRKIPFIFISGSLSLFFFLQDPASVLFCFFPPKFHSKEKANINTLNRLIPEGAEPATALTPTHFCCCSGEPDLSGQSSQNRILVWLWGHPRVLKRSHGKLPSFCGSESPACLNIPTCPRISEFSLGNSTTWKTTPNGIFAADSKAW